jgi:tetratricopeptide (TPR) repeat protein
MNWTCKLLAVALAAVACLSLDLHAQSTAAAELNLGVEADKQTKYADAIQHFRRAVSLDPENQNAHMYLAKAYVKQYIPGVHTPDNTHLAEQAIEQYQYVLDSDSNRTPKIDSAKSIAELYFQMNKFDDSKMYLQWASDLDPKDPEPYYAIGRIDSIECSNHDRESLLPGEPRPTPSKKTDQKKACDELKAMNGPIIEEGINSLNKAIELRPHYDDAIASLQLMYRQKADLECDDPVARAADLKTADERIDKTYLSTISAPGDSSVAIPPLIPPGMRVFPVRENDITSVSCFVPCTWVDVLLTGNPQGSNEQQTTTVLENVAVIATHMGEMGFSRLLECDSASEAESAPVVNLLVSPDDAERLELTSQVGHIQLVPRN